MLDRTPPSKSRLSVREGFCTDLGLGREVNEDSVQLIPRTRSGIDGMGLYAVADGIGGHRGGSVASGAACRQLSRYLDRLGPAAGMAQDEKETARNLGEIFFRIDKEIKILGKRDKALEHMGTTLTCLVHTRTHAIIGHVGDSRGYRLRKGHLSLLTTDHTFVQDMLFEGEIGPERALTHPLRHMLTRAVGTGEILEHVDIRMDPLAPGDRFLLCTDGLYGRLEPERIAEILSRRPDPETAAADLVHGALERGTQDNATAVVIYFDG